MNDEKVLTAVKSILESTIDTLKEWVDKNQEFTYTHGRLDDCEWILSVINNQEELIDRLYKIE